MTRKQKLTMGAISVVAVLFGLATLVEGGTTLFGNAAERAAAGNIVPFVLWFNFVAGFAYVASGIGLWLRYRWAVWLAVAIAGATVVTSAALGVHVYVGGDYETRTLGAMALRSFVWVSIAAVAYTRGPR